MLYAYLLKLQLKKSERINIVLSNFEYEFKYTNFFCLQAENVSFIDTRDQQGIAQKKAQKKIS